MAVLAIIPARGGSKRIPRKNIKEFCGKPIIAYSIEAAQDSGIFDEIMVSTDDEEIAKTAIAYGATVPFMRSGNTSTDFATQRDVLLEVVKMYEERQQSFEYMCCIYATAPFITGNRLKEAFEMLLAEKAGAVFPVVEYDYPPQRAYIINSGFLEYKNPEFAVSRSQDLDTMLHDCGQFYFYRTDAFINKKSTMIEKVKPLQLSKSEVQDIDTEEDWELAELKYKLLRETNH